MSDDQKPCSNCGINLFIYGKATSGGIRCTECHTITKTCKDDFSVWQFMAKRRKELEKEGENIE